MMHNGFSMSRARIPGSAGGRALGRAKATWTRAACGLLLGTLAMLASVSAAHATLIFTLNSTSCTGCGTSPWGTVAVSQDSSGSNAIDFTVTLNSPYDIHKTASNQHPAFAVDINALNVTFSNFKLNNVATTRVTTIAGGATAAGYGTFPYALSASQNLAGVLTFTAKVATGTLSPTNIVSNGHAYTVADIIDTLNGGTGNVADVNPPVKSPEPTTLSLVVLGLAGLGLARRRRR